MAALKGEFLKGTQLDGVSARVSEAQSAGVG